jgi:hypothetical protein
MAKGDIVSVTSRPLRDEEKDIVTWTEAQEAENITNLEAGARQIISLITAFYGFIFGALALGSEKFAAGLRLPWVMGLGGLAVVLLLLALGAALAVVAPRSYPYREARLDDMRAIYTKILAFKSGWLLRATILFGLGLAGFAGLIISLLLARP